MRALLWMTLFAVSVIFAEPVNLAQLKDDYIAQSGDTLTDTLSGDYMLSIADGAEVVLKNVVVVGDEYAHGGAGITCKGSCTIILEDSNYVRPFSQEAPGIYIPEGHTLVIEGSGTPAPSSTMLLSSLSGATMCLRLTIPEGRFRFPRMRNRPASNPTRVKKED